MIELDNDQVHPVAESVFAVGLKMVNNKILVGEIFACQNVFLTSF